MRRRGGERVAGHTAEDKVVVRTLEEDIGRGVRRYLEAAVRFAFTENWEFVISYTKDSKVANCPHAQPVFYGFARLAHGKVISVSVLRVSWRRGLSR